jgi:hemerythrin superfamily protein
MVIEKKRTIDNLKRGLRILEKQLKPLVTENTRKAYLDIVDAAEDQIETMKQLVESIKADRKRIKEIKIGK